MPHISDTDVLIFQLLEVIWKRKETMKKNLYGKRNKAASFATQF